MLRSRSVVYVLSAQTGEYLNTLSIPNVVAHYGGFYLTGDAKLQKIFGFESGYPTTPLFTIQAPNGQIITDAQSLLYPFTDFTQNGFFVYNDTLKPDQVLAYDTLGNKQWQINEKLLTFPVLLVHHVVVYSIDGLKIYNYNTGKLEYTIRLKRNSPNNETVDEPNSVWIAVYKNIVVLYFRKFWDMVALQVDELQ
jgi:hypothetical protein